MPRSTKRVSSPTLAASTRKCSRSPADDRQRYLMRPDLGRRLAPLKNDSERLLIERG